MVRLWGFALFVWITASLLGGLYENTNPFPQAEPAPNLSCEQLVSQGYALRLVLNFQVLQMQEVDLVLLKARVPVPNTCFFTALSHLAFWDFAFIRDNWGLNLLRIGLLSVISGMVLMGATIYVAPVVIGAVQAARNMFRI